MRKRKVEGKTIIKWLWVPWDAERNKINGVSQHMSKRPRGASQAEINEESGKQHSQSYDLQVKVVEADTTGGVLSEISANYLRKLKNKLHVSQ